ncbi:unnamed protein product [Heterobilharzia americana]|nr:unnamed protein product [Heterobilharzia americana]
MKCYLLFVAIHDSRYEYLFVQEYKIPDFEEFVNEVIGRISNIPLEKLYENYFEKSTQRKCYPVLGGVRNSPQQELLSKNPKREKKNTSGNGFSKTGSELQVQEADGVQYQDLPGTWVECSFCSKWRYLPNVHDPSQLESSWYCALNPKYSRITPHDSYSNKYIHNPCEEPEDFSAVRQEDDFIFGHFSVGSVVWAKIQGYPYWPAMVYYSSQGKYAEFDSNSKEVTHYNVVFLDPSCSTMSRVTSSRVHKFTTFDEMDLNKVPKRFWRRLRAAGQEAEDALLLSVKDRIAAYGYAHQSEDIAVKIRPKEIKSKDNSQVGISLPTHQSMLECCCPNGVKQKRVYRRKSSKISSSSTVENSNQGTEYSLNTNCNSLPNGVECSSKDNSQVGISLPTHQSMLECCCPNGVKQKRVYRRKSSKISSSSTVENSNQGTEYSLNTNCNSLPNGVECSSKDNSQVGISLPTHQSMLECCCPNGVKQKRVYRRKSSKISSSSTVENSNQGTEYSLNTNCNSLPNGVECSSKDNSQVGISLPTHQSMLECCCPNGVKQKRVYRRKSSKISSSSTVENSNQGTEYSLNTNCNSLPNGVECSSKSQKKFQTANSFQSLQTSTNVKQKRVYRRRLSKISSPTTGKSKMEAEYPLKTICNYSMNTSGYSIEESLSRNSESVVKSLQETLITLVPPASNEDANNGVTRESPEKLLDEVTSFINNSSVIQKNSVSDEYEDDKGIHFNENFNDNDSLEGEQGQTYDAEIESQNYSPSF